MMENFYRKLVVKLLERELSNSSLTEAQLDDFLQQLEMFLDEALSE